MADLINNLSLLIQRGGIVMIPLLALSVVALALVIERAWFWLSTHSRARLSRLERLNDALRRGERSAAAKLIRGDRAPYAEVARRLIDDGASEAVAIEAVEAVRPQVDRFMVSLSTIISAAPMLGILGTVTGIIQAFNLLGQQDTLTDPRVVSGGIAEALLTTAVGLVVALLALFPYMVFRGQSERAMGRLESLIASAQQGDTAATAKPEHLVSHRPDDSRAAAVLRAGA